MRLGTVLKKYRIFGDIPAKQLADDMGLSIASYYRIEEGRMTNGDVLMRCLIWLTAQERKRVK